MGRERRIKCILNICQNSDRSCQVAQWPGLLAANLGALFIRNQTPGLIQSSENKDRNKSIAK